MFSQLTHFILHFIIHIVHVHLMIYPVTRNIKEFGLFPIADTSC